MKRPLHSQGFGAPVGENPNELFAKEVRTGARGLRAVLEEVMLEMMYELPSMPGLKECIITREVILNKERPILISEQKEQSA